jgi:hypothetical protein
MRALGDMAADLIDVKLHGFGVGVGQHKGCPFSAGRADGAEQIGTRVALIGRLARSCATSCPLPDDAILLADPGLVLPPYLHPCAFRQVGQMRLQRAREVFLYASTISASCAGWRGRALMWEKPSFFSSVETWRSW